MKKNATMHTLKTYEHILARMKKDEIKALQKKNELERSIKLLEKQLK